MNVYVATYQHKHGQDMRVFASAAMAEAWREEIAREYWAECNTDAMPANAAKAADEYFDRRNQLGDEWFEVEEIKVEGCE